MKPNMGGADRAIRLVVAVAIGFLYFTGRVSGIVGVALLLVAAVLVLTSAVSRCPAYLPFGLSTRHKP